MTKYEDTRHLVIRSLENALVAHLKNDLLSIEKGTEEDEKFVSEANVVPNSLLCLPLEYRACWSDSSVHS